MLNLKISGTVFLSCASTLNDPLTPIYPKDNPILNETRRIQNTIRALDNYVVEGFARTMEAMLKSVVKGKPHLVYAIACRHNLPELADQAAVETLRSPMLLTNGPLSDSQILQMTSVDLRRLLHYHFSALRPPPPRYDLGYPRHVPNWR